MILRMLTLAGGLAGAAGLSQFPEFSQQYTQRLGGAVDALAEVVADFDASAAAVGLGREQALAQMQGTEFLDRRRADMAATFRRYDRLRADLAAIEGQGPFMRAYHAARLTDRQIARAAWAAYRPAVPVHFAGLVFAAVGFVLGVAVCGALCRLLAAPFRRAKRA
ncbi:hypothetical protein BOO69_05255 [Sulfitobacter alexandrii]|uniref:DUF2937 family protein n=1 Tax=Sulfitobacter alexandrii TaxID=1917485 RepID=A0A1J0WEZ9_9RHOB|nr:DUF2937 family protein [Sulfitobacter alexandrii]APE42895.1 hypothetical protein BOO69_05255 [Sulfitobacter alexandrii]